MTNWKSEQQELSEYYEILRGSNTELEEELHNLLNCLDEGAALLWRTRRTLEIIVTDLCVKELKRPRGTDPLHNVINNLKNIMPENVHASMLNTNNLGNFGAHPKPVTIREVRQALIGLGAVLCWYLEDYKGLDKTTSTEEVDQASVIESKVDQVSVIESKPHKGIESNPYKGLDVFEEKDADRFFGRELLLEERLWPAFQALATAPTRLMALVGPSGSGKSSLARAGLLPLLKQQLPACRLLVTTPGSHPLETLAHCLAQLPQPAEPFPAGKLKEFFSLLEELKADDNQGLRRIADLFYEHCQAPLILLIDQFEEVFSLCKDINDERRYLDNLLVAASDPAPHLYLLLTLRSDFLRETQSYPAFNQVLSCQACLVPVLDDDGLRRAITEPANRAGRALDDGVVQLLIEQSTGREGALPLLQSALSVIWQELQHGQSAVETLRKIGGVGGALAGQAQTIYQKLSAVEQRIAQRSFLKLVQLGEGSPDTRRRVLLDDLIAQGERRETVRNILHCFAVREARFLTFGQEVDGQEWVEITHDALIIHWTELREWLNATRDDLRLLNRLEGAVKHWDANKQAKGLLWRDPDLDLLQVLAGRMGNEFTALQVAFHQTSKKEKRNAIIKKWFTVIFPFVFIVVIFIYQLEIEHNKQETEYRIQTSNYAKQAIEEITRATESTLVNKPEMDQQRKDLLEKLLVYYQKLAQLKAEEPGVLSDLADAVFRAGNIKRQLGKPVAVEDYNRVIEIYTALVNEHPDKLQYKIDLVMILNNTGLLQRNNGDMAGALTSYQIANTIYKQLPNEYLIVPKYQSTYAAILDNLGLLEQDLGKTENALKYYADSVEIREQLTNKYPDELQDQHLLANTNNNLGDLQRKNGSTVKAEAAYKKAQDIYEKLVKQAPKEQKYQNGLAASYMGLGLLKQNTNHAADANTYFAKAASILNDLANNHPDMPKYKSYSAFGYNNLGNLQSDGNDVAKAQASYSNAVKLFDTLVEKYPNVLEYKIGLASSYNNLGNAQFDDNTVDAKKAYEKAVEIQDSLVKEFSRIPEYKDALASSYGNLANVESQNGKVAEALAFYNKAIAIQEQLKESYPEVPEYQNHLAHSYYNQGNLLGADGKKSQKAQDSYKVARDIWVELVKDHPDIPEYKRNLVVTLGNRAWQSLLLGEAQEAVTDADNALNRDPDQTWIKVNLAHGLLLDKHYPEALVIYKENKDAKLDDSRTFAQTVLEDFKQLDVNKVPTQYMEEIKKMLLDSKTKKHH